MAALITPSLGGQARAFDFFGLLGSEEEPPPPSPDALPYKIEFSGLDDDANLAQRLKDASNSWRLRLQPPVGGVALAQRVVADLPRIGEALWGDGYFDAQVKAEVAGVEIFPDGRGADAAARAAEQMRDKTPVPVVFKVEPGPLFHLRNVVVYDARRMTPIDPALFSKKTFERGPDEPARAARVRALEADLVDQLRAQSYPLAKIVKTAPVILHRDQAMDVAITVDPGPRAGIGEVKLSGSPGVPDDVIRSFIYLEEGEDYSPRKLADTRKSVARIEALGSVKVEDGPALDSNGNMPILVTTSERKQHAVGVTGQISNIDGPGLRAYWMDRNVFGGGERLRFDVQGGLAATATSGSAAGSFFSLPRFDSSNLIGSAKMSFVKPALEGSRNDLLVDAYAVREKTPYYWANYGGASTGIRHRFSDAASIQAGVEIEAGHTFDAFGPHNYTLLGVPVSANYDSTDDLLAPTKGVRAVATVEPYFKTLHDSVGMVQSQGQVSTYYALDDDAWYILAGRAKIGSIVGASIADIPASHRFFAGGGGSVRGYQYRSLAPQYGMGFAVGGRSLLEGSAEARIKITKEIGIVPFFDTGMAFASSFPNFQSPMRYAAGLGLRYYSGIGPIRLDLATPIARKPGESAYALFIGIGEAF
ncbi:BamA/TamA family outer membrane protein [Methylocystis heyeri]|uniref:BamA/TamA family outer membrane protein n=2 Tax=Methylocystis heyeri TaxID=391905 RepID=A0A6B8KM79_9HYPH|nr:BamA/TamA family outer membrane protein [Methylocystis heyeri]